MEERKRELRQRHEAQRVELELEEAFENDPQIVRAYGTIAVLVAIIAERRQELRAEAALPLEQQSHADQDAIDAAFAALLADLDL